MKSSSNETDIIKEPPKFAVKFANVVFILGILHSVILALGAWSFIVWPPTWVAGVEIIKPGFYYILILFCGFIAALCGIGLMLSNNLKVNLSLLLFSVVFTAYAMETFLVVKAKFNSSQSVQQSVPYIGDPPTPITKWDTRNTFEVIKDLNATGIKAYPNHFPKLSVRTNGLNTANGKIFPLGGISNITTPLDNEAGFWPIFESDEHGFNNAKGLYKKNSVDIMLTGDSFTEGYSVHFDENIAAVLRKLDFKAISLGKGDNGPLIELAALREYAKPLQPKIVLWMYTASDISDLSVDMRSSLLRRYLNEGFTQNLMSRQDEIDSLLKSYIDGEAQKITNNHEEQVNSMIRKWMRFLTLTRSILIPLFSSPDRTTEWKILMEIKKSRGLKYLRPPSPEIKQHIVIFKDILEKAKKMVHEWGGVLYFVHIVNTAGSVNSPDFEYVKPILAELNIPVIDTLQIFDSHPNPSSLVAGHLNAYGYRLVAESIAERLKSDGIIPLKSTN